MLPNCWYFSPFCGPINCVQSPCILVMILRITSDLVHAKIIISFLVNSSSHVTRQSRHFKETGPLSLVMWYSDKPRRSVHLDTFSVLDTGLRTSVPDVASLVIIVFFNIIFCPFVGIIKSIFWRLHLCLYLLGCVVPRLQSFWSFSQVVLKLWISSSVCLLSFLSLPFYSWSSTGCHARTISVYTIHDGI